MHLRCELRGHSEDVRGICFCPVGIVSTSRDKTVKIWKETDEGTFQLDKTLIGHEEFVVPVIWIPPGTLPQFPEGTLATGARDGHVIVWDIDNAIPALELNEHTQQVTALGVLSDGTIVSSSVDGTLKLWKDGICVATLEDHKGSVVSLLVLPEDQILSGSIDKSIKLWSGGSCISTFTGHDDTVRAMTLAPELGIISASHDTTLRLWSMTGDCLTIYTGHSEIVYSCALSESRCIASGSEDGTARLWDMDGKCLKSIYHPGCVWAVGFLPNNDLITACSDGVIRIFTEDEDRLAEEDVRQSFEAAVSIRRDELLASRKGTLPPGVKIDDPSILYMPGSKDGETKIIAEGLGACAYAWNEKEGEWKKLGDVLGTQPGELASASKFHNGQEWDYVFDVDFEENAPIKKIFMNKDENPYDVAERFLLAENLPIEYKEQVVQFLMNNTQLRSSVPTNPDPLTGESSYRPQAELAPDVFAGLGFLDESTTTFQFKFCPKNTPVLFNTLKSAEVIKTKILKFNEEVTYNPETRSLALSEEETGEKLDHLLEEVKNIAAGRKAELTDADIELVTKLIKFPRNTFLPVLDICRLLALEPSFQSKLVEWIGPNFDGILATSLIAVGLHPMTLYLLTNALSQPLIRSEISDAFVVALDAFKEATGSQFQNIRVGYGSVILNLAIHYYMTGTSETESRKRLLLDQALDTINTLPPDDMETAFRVLVAMGTLLYDDATLKQYSIGIDVMNRIACVHTRVLMPDKLKKALVDFVMVLKDFKTMSESSP